MKIFCGLLSAACLWWLVATTDAQTNVVTDPVGFYKVVLLTNSDSFVSIPFTRPPAYTGIIDAISSNVVMVSGSPWTNNQFVYNPSGGQSNTYYMLIVSTNNNREGAYYLITANTTNTLTIDLVPEDLGGVGSGDRISIIPFWTLNTVFPNGEGITPSPAIGGKKTLVLFPNIGGQGINLAAAKSFYYSSVNGQWQELSSGTTNYNDQIILPDQYFIVRQQNNAPTSNCVFSGVVPMYKVRIPLYAQSGIQQDSFVALYRPAEQTLNESGLSNVFLASPLIGGKKDLLLVYDNNATNINKSAVKTYYYSQAGMWREFSSGTNDVGSEVVFRPGTGVIIRKVPTNMPTIIWQNLPNYSNQ